MKRLVYLFLFIFLTGFTTRLQTEAQEYNLKAVFIYNFTKYISWNSYGRGNEFIIGILGPSLINEPLAEIARTKTVDNKKIVIRQFNTPHDITFCNILFISRRSYIPAGSFLSLVPTGTLTIAEEEGMAQDGIAFNFVIDDHKLKFEANLKAISTAGLKASSDLLQHAIIVEP